MLVRQGLTTKEIAQSTGLAPGTVDSYIAEGIALLGARNRRHAASMFDDPPSKMGAQSSGVAERPRSLLELLPFRRKGAIGNDLTPGQRAFWILAIAFAGAIAFGMLASGVHFLSDLIGYFR